MKTIRTDQAPAPIGPYSQAVEANGFIFLSGQIAINPRDNSIPDDVDAQTRQVITNMVAVLKAAGSDLGKVVKTTIYLSDMNDFSRVNAIYAEYFDQSKPARATVEVRRLPRDVRIEMDCIAVK
ncbi:MAG: RidA family protein [Calditrichaeota bacterium]|nr:MAG: RidA family protein [Calditrichota bacterium]